MDIEEFGPFLKKLRVDEGITQKNLAERLGVTVSSISKWERGKCLPEITKIEELAEIFQISTSDMLSCSLKSEEQKTFKTVLKSNLIKYLSVSLAIIIAILGYIFISKSIKTVHGYLDVTLIDKQGTEYIFQIEPYVEDISNYNIILSSNDEWYPTYSTTLKQDAKYQIEYEKTGKIKDGSYLHNVVSIKER